MEWPFRGAPAAAIPISPSCERLRSRASALRVKRATLADFPPISLARLAPKPISHYSLVIPVMQDSIRWGFTEIKSRV